MKIFRHLPPHFLFSDFDKAILYRETLKAALSNQYQQDNQLLSFKKNTREGTFFQMYK